MSIEQQIESANRAVDQLPRALGSVRTEAVLAVMLIQSVDRLALALDANTKAIRDTAGDVDE